MSDTQQDEQTEQPQIDWHMSAALRNVPRGDLDVAEVTSLERAVLAWTALDPEHQAIATITPERPVVLDGVDHAIFQNADIPELAKRLPSNEQETA